MSNLDPAQSPLVLLAYGEEADALPEFCRRAPEPTNAVMFVPWGLPARLPAHKMAAGRLEKLAARDGEVKMQAVTIESWKGRTVRIHVFPVRRIDTRDAAPAGFIATVKIVRSCHILADWHLPFFSERWLSEGEAQRNAFEYAVKLIDSGVLDEPQWLHHRAA
ncbi:MAG TPA: hypothetical protein VJS30_07335 [Paraburkholderia sp.]|nr:hypothetical protein [Paraburkholderia sp.]